MIASNIIQIGNSKGLRIPKTLLNACGFVKEVFISIDENSLIITPAHKKKRKNWSEDAKKLANESSESSESSDSSVIFSSGNDFDISQWEWK